MSLSRFDLSLLAGFYAPILLVLLLEPFDFHSHLLGCEVKRFAGTNGVEIQSEAGIHSASPVAHLYRALVSGKGFTVEVWGAARNIVQKGPARIVSYSHDKYLRNFTLGQDGNDLILRLRTTTTNLDGRNPEMRIEDVFSPAKLLHIVVTFDYSNESVYINGKRKTEIPGPGGTFSNWNPSYPLVLGNEANGYRPWLGSLFLVAIYNRALSEQEVRQNNKAGWIVNPSAKAGTGRVVKGLVALYPIDEKAGSVVFDRSRSVPSVDLHILTGPEITQQKFLSSPYRNFHFTFKWVFDVVGNIVLFIPFGILLHAMIKTRYRSSLGLALFVIMLGALFSLVIESLQYFSIARFSSMTDVVNNTIGTALGVTIGKMYTFFAISHGDSHGGIERKGEGHSIGS